MPTAWPTITTPETDRAAILTATCWEGRFILLTLANCSGERRIERRIDGFGLSAFGYFGPAESWSLTARTTFAAARSCGCRSGTPRSCNDRDCDSLSGCGSSVPACETGRTRGCAWITRMYGCFRSGRRLAEYPYQPPYQMMWSTKDATAAAVA